MAIEFYNNRVLWQSRSMAIGVNVFVYGTLKPGERYHRAYCAEFLIDAVPAIAQGNLYHLPDPHNYPAMTEGTGRVVGYLLRFCSEKALIRLDELEDYDPQGPSSQNLYDRRWIEICDHNGRELGQAWGYIMAEATVHQLHGIPVENGNWHPDP